MSVVIVVNGPPGAGKTMLAKAISKDLEIPILAKDSIKESLFDTLGYSDRDRSMELGYAAFTLHLQLAQELASNKGNFIFEGAFQTKSTADIANSLKGSKIIQAWIKADIDIMLERSSTRPRHPGYCDSYEGYEQEIRDKVNSGVHDPLDIGGTLIRVNSNDFSSSNFSRAYDQIISSYANVV